MYKLERKVRSATKSTASSHGITWTVETPSVHFLRQEKLVRPAVGRHSSAGPPDLCTMNSPPRRNSQTKHIVLAHFLARPVPRSLTHPTRRKPHTSTTSIFLAQLFCICSSFSPSTRRFGGKGQPDSSEKKRSMEAHQETCDLCETGIPNAVKIQRHPHEYKQSNVPQATGLQQECSKRPKLQPNRSTTQRFRFYVLGMRIRRTGRKHPTQGPRTHAAIRNVQQKNTTRGLGRGEY